VKLCLDCSALVAVGSLFFNDWTSLDPTKRMKFWDKRFKNLVSYPQVGEIFRGSCSPDKPHSAHPQAHSSGAGLVFGGVSAYKGHSSRDGLCMCLNAMHSSIANWHEGKMAPSVFRI